MIEPSSLRPTPWEASHLVRGATYRVVEPFTDFDGRLHPVGEQWRFDASSFVPYDDGLTVYVTSAEGRSAIRLCWRPDAQGAVCDGFAAYVERIDG